MSPPRAPSDRESLLSASKFLNHHADGGNDLDEVADLLTDIANGKWTLVDARCDYLYVRVPSDGQ